MKTASANDVCQFLATGADVNMRDGEGWTPLHWAAEYSKLPGPAKALIKAGADVNAQDDDGWTPLHHAAALRQNGIEIVALLLKAGADPNARDHCGLTVPHTVALWNGAPGVISALIEAGADPTSRMKDGNTPCDLIETNSPLHGTEIHRTLAKYR